MGATWIATVLTMLATLVAPRVNDLRLCPRVGSNAVHCHSVVVSDAVGRPHATTDPHGLGPADLISAYQLPAGAPGQLVAIVNAYDAPTAEADVETFRTAYRLPPCRNLCVRKVNQSGGTSYPSFDEGWALESSLDLQVVTAVCPSCQLLLVEARSSSTVDMMAAEDEAVALGAKVINNSWGGPESSRPGSLDKHFNHHGVMITVSSGDTGYGVEYPASSPYVTAVGGTTLKRSNNARGWIEKAWSGSGSGCSAYERQPDWQRDNPKIRDVCGKRAVADVSAVADPKTGFGVYDSAGFSGERGWFVLGGTSLSSPIIAGVYALAGNASSLKGASHAYANPSQLYPVRSGRNGMCGTSMCKAGKGWNGPTGLGTPKGIGAF